MRKRFQNNIIATMGLASCLTLTALTLTMLLRTGASPMRLSSVFGAVVGLVADAFTAPASAISAGSDRAGLEQVLYQCGALPLMLVFSALFWRATWNAGARARAAPAQLLLLVQLVIAAAVEPAMLFLFAAELGLVMPLRRGLKWLGLQIALTALERLFTAFIAGARDDGALNELVGLFIDTGFYVLAFGTACVAVLEQRARTGLSAANAELKATQVLLGDTVRTSERLRIARDLHDHVGHHLTALNLHLDLAQRQASGPMRELLDTSRELSNALLAEVRRVVSQERDNQQIDLAQALAELCAGIPRPQIRLALAEPLAIASTSTAHVVFRCVQESLSNAIRHADASLVTISVARHGDELVARVDDDGVGHASGAEGNGLRGMRERVEAIGGTLAAANQRPRGYAIEVRLPLHAEHR